MALIVDTCQILHQNNSILQVFIINTSTKRIC